MDLITAMTAVSHALDAAKKLRDMEKDFDAATFRLEISNLMLALAEAKEALAETKSDLADMREQLSRADAEIARLMTAASNKLQTVLYRGFEFGIKDGQAVGLPFCPTCIATTGKQVQIVRMVENFHQCPVCKSMFGDPPQQLPGNLVPKA